MTLRWGCRSASSGDSRPSSTSSWISEWSICDLGQLALAEQVAAGVADVGHVHHVAVLQQGDQGGAHAVQLAVAGRHLADAPVGPQDGLLEVVGGGRLVLPRPRSPRAVSSSMAMALATSPALWPPMPSATAATGLALR